MGEVDTTEVGEAEGEDTHSWLRTCITESVHFDQLTCGRANQVSTRVPPLPLLEHPHRCTVNGTLNMALEVKFITTAILISMN